MKPRKCAFILLMLTTLSGIAHCQNRMYVTLSGGAAFGIEERGSSYAPGPAYGLTWTSESRISGSVYSLIGLGIEHTENNQNQFEYFQSNVKQTSVTLPLLLRYNALNANRIYLDIGVIPSYIMSCNINETGFSNTSFQGEVSNDISPVRMAFALAQTVSFGVVNIGWQLNWKLIDGNTSVLARKWTGAGSRSVFVENAGNSHGAVINLNVGFRIK